MDGRMLLRVAGNWVSVAVVRAGDGGGFAIFLFGNQDVVLDAIEAFTPNHIMLVSVYPLPQNDWCYNRQKNKHQQSHLVLH